MRLTDIFGLRRRFASITACPPNAWADFPGRHGGNRGGLIAISRRIDTGIDVPTVLSRVPLLRLLGDEAIQTLGLTAHVHEYPDARIIINQGDPGSSLFVVIAGLLEVAQCDASGRHGAVGRLVPGDVFGEIFTSDRGTAYRHSHHAHPGDIDRNRQAAAAADRNAIDPLPGDQEKIDSMGMAAFLRQRILQFFGPAA
jgi:hypothetical protein